MSLLEKNEREVYIALRISFLFAIFALLLVFGLPKAEAYPVIIEIEAVVDDVEDDDNYLEGQIDVGDIITGYYIYESTTEDSSPLDPVQGNYWHYEPPAGISLSVGGFDFVTDSCNVEFCVVIRNNNASGDDIYGIHSDRNLPLSNGTVVDYISWSLKDHTGSVFSNDALPTTAPILEQWQANWLRLETDKVFSIDAYVTSAVPEPTSIFLLGLGALFAKTRTRIKRVE